MGSKHHVYADAPRSADVDPEFVDEHAAATYLGVAAGTLQQWRVRGGGPAYYKYGRGPQGAVRYCLSDLREWAERHRRSSTSDQEEG